MRSHVKCSVCHERIDAEVGPPTKRGEFEYRFATHHFYYFEPGTDEKHVCHLKPRQWISAEEPTPARVPEPTFEEPPPPEDAPMQEAEPIRSRYKGELE